MFKKIIYIVLAMVSLAILISCGSGSDTVPTVKYNSLAFDTASTNTSIPFPNDLMWRNTGGIVDLTSEAGDDTSKLALYTAIKSLNIKGLSPNTPIAIPLTDDIKLSSSSFIKSIRVVDLSDNNSENINMEIKQNSNIINIYPLKPLAAGHRYLVIITDDLEDYRGYPVMPSVIYKTIRDTDNCSTLDSSDLQQLCSSYEPLWNIAASLTGKNKEGILEVFTFTTADKTLSLNDFAVIANPLIKIDNSTISGYSYSNVDADNASNEYIQVDALSDLPLLCQNYTTITDNTTYFKSLNLYKLASINDIIINNQSNYNTVCTAIFDNASLYDNVTIKIDNQTTASGILIFQHGLGGDKSAIDSIKDDFSNFIVVGMDLPWHGDRVLGSDLPETSCYDNISGSCYLTDNPIYDRLNIYQSIFDMHVLTKMFGLQAAIQKLPLYFAGQSMGSITGSMLMNVDNVTLSNVALNATGSQKGNNFISKAVLNVGGGNYAALLNEATNSLITGLLSALNLEKHSIEYYTTLGIFQLLLDPVDPAYFADNPAISSKVLLQSANHDTVVPNITNKVLAYAYNYSDYNSITDSTNDTDDIIAKPTAGWYMFGNGDNWVNHGFLLNTSISYYTEANGYLVQTYVDTMQGLALKQALNFITNNAGSGQD